MACCISSPVVHFFFLLNHLRTIFHQEQTFLHNIPSSVQIKGNVFHRQVEFAIEGERSVLCGDTRTDFTVGFHVSNDPNVTAAAKIEEIIIVGVCLFSKQLPVKIHWPA